MRKLVAAVMILCAAVGVGYAQRRKTVGGQPRVYLSRDKPSVYISFVRVAERKPLYAGESNKGVWLRLHNNTRWSIFIPAFDLPAEYGDVGIFYDIEQVAQLKQSSDKRAPQGYKQGHSSSTLEVGSGDSVIFSVPNEHLAEGLFLRVLFSYGWEKPDDVFAGREPEHYVRYGLSDMPR